jgi:hypothetical protein
LINGATFKDLFGSMFSGDLLDEEGM